LEFSFEAGRPDCITTSKLAILKNYGVNRVSINTQSTNDDVLKHVGRNHTYDQFVKAFESARKIGFDNINTDLIAGLPGESLSSFKRSVDDLCLISPDNVTIHAFTLKKSSDYREDNVKDFQICTNDAQEMIDYSYRVLSDNLYVPYYVYRQKNTVANLDNTGYCKNNKECIYNIVTMGEYHTVLAAGAGAVTKLVSKDTNTVERIFSPKYPYEFLDQSKYYGFKINSVSEFYTSKY
jgi:oxygen-independent coproporphyrinogen-3 oxidase